jgi:hypothetical protein
MGDLVRPNFLSGGPIVERATPATVVPIRTPWRGLMDLADARRLEGIAALADCDDEAGWRLIDQAKGIEQLASRLRRIEEATIAAHERAARQLVAEEF